jgi:DNA-directed RNA polymerase subunit alpha
MAYKLPETSLMQTKLETEDGNTATFVVEPLSPGFGLTLGNSLRRVLLSSLEGAAITSIRIDGVSHEFTTIKGVLQDVVDLILNLKQVRLNFTADEPQVIILDAKSEGVVKAGDFKCPTGVGISNKNLIIAELARGGKLLLEATVERGRGYVPTELRKDEKLPIGVIAIDAAFSPIKRVNFQTENTRVGKMTNFDKLILEIETDGTVKPYDAFQYASQVLVEHFSILAGESSQAEIPSVETEITQADQEKVNETITELPKKVSRTSKLSAKESKKTASPKK